MAFNPLEEKGIPIEKQITDWGKVNVQPYNKNEVHPYTRTRVILMNGIEVESAIFLHQFARHTTDIELKRALALTRRVEQQQQKMVNWLVPGDESNLEVTIGYEQVAVDLTAHLAQNEPDRYVKAALDFALLEDFDHLYRYANLLSMQDGVDPAKVVGSLTEIMPGRPTSQEHRHPYDEVRRNYDKSKAELKTKLNVATIIAAEQQTMNFYMTVGNRLPDMLGRGLYLEIAQIEEQHVTHYESLADPTMSWYERLFMHDYNEAYLYYSCMMSEEDTRIRAIWEEHLNMEIAHVQMARELMQKHEKRDPAEMVSEGFPEPIVFHENKEYVREVIEKQVALTSSETQYVPLLDLPQDHRFYTYQHMVHGGETAPSDEVIEQHVKAKKSDYTFVEKGAKAAGR